MKKIVSLIVFISITAALSGCLNNYVVTRTQFLMGTMVKIGVADADMSRADKLSAINKAFARIKEIEGLMFSCLAGSDVSRVNNFADIRPIEVSCDTMKVIKRADEINNISGGAFDITVGPLVELWGFGPKGAVLKMPSDKDIAETLKLTGMDKMKIDYVRRTVSFAKPGMKMDLAGIAKGYAVDCAVSVLKSCGVKNAYVGAGQNIYCLGKVRWRKQWRVDIQHPRDKNKLLETIYLQDKAISTSCDYQRSFFWGKKRISHIMDPKTGRPIVDVPASVTIIAPDCMTADAFAKAVYVMWPDKGKVFLSKISSVEAMVSVDNGKEIEVYETDGFKQK